MVILDFLRDAELCAKVFHSFLTCSGPFDVSMGEFQKKRDDQVLPMYEFTTELATLEPPPPPVRQVLAAMRGNQEAMDGFARVNAGVTSPADFFSPENVGRILAAATP
jgi:hypothetical protein